ncbi:hypothetical protein NPIL_626321, partial [Nephila pilipes]
GRKSDGDLKLRHLKGVTLLDIVEKREIRSVDKTTSDLILNTVWCNPNGSEVKV